MGEVGTDAAPPFCIGMEATVSNAGQGLVGTYNIPTMTSCALDTPHSNAGQGLLHLSLGVGVFCPSRSACTQALTVGTLS